MGFFDWFRKPKIDPAKLVIKAEEHSIEINGTAIPMICQLSNITDILGKGRIHRGAAGNLNMVWDKLGVYCYFTPQQRVYCIAVKRFMDTIPTELDPKKLFQGELYIGGTHWEEFMQAGEDIEIGRERNLGGVSLFATYCDLDRCDYKGFRNAYNGVEINYAG